MILFRMKMRIIRWSSMKTRIIMSVSRMGIRLSRSIIKIIIISLIILIS